jgi:hypothetical protein
MLLPSFTRKILYFSRVERSMTRPAIHPFFWLGVLNLLAWLRFVHGTWLTAAWQPPCLDACLNARSGKIITFSPARHSSYKHSQRHALPIMTVVLRYHYAVCGSVGEQVGSLA